MNDQYSFNNIDSLLFRFGLRIQELSQKKNDINQQIEVLRADITERKSCIETLHRDIKKLEEDIRVKQSTVIHNKENAKSMKATNGLLLQYEQRLKEELESRKASYMRDMKVYEERIANYRKIFQSHKEHYCQDPLAQKFLVLQADKEEIESRIKACDDQITMKQKELDHLTDPAEEELPDSVSGQQAIEEPEKQLDPHTEEGSDSSIDISSLHLNQTEISENGRETSVDANAEKIHKENKDQDGTICRPFPGETNDKLWSSHLDEQRCQDVMHTEEQDQETEPWDQVLASTLGKCVSVQEQDSTVSDVEELVEQEEIEERVAVDEEQAPGKEHNEELAAFPESSPQKTNPQSSPATVKAVPSTPTFPFDFSPGRSPHQGTSDTKSPAFLFSLNSDPSTPGFFGLGFDVGPSQDEDSSFAFPGSFFNEKKTTESKASSSADFLFGQPEQSEDFQFVFNHKSPQTTNKDNTGDDFPFSFNF